MSNILRGTLIIAISTLLSRVLGVVREILMARIVGAGVEKSAYDLAFLIPDLLNHLVSTGYLSLTFIPLFIGLKKEESEKKAWELFGKVFFSLGSVLLLFSLGAWIFARPLILLLAAQPPSPELLENSVSLSRILIPAQIFFFAGSLFTAVQHVQSRFFLPALSGIIYNLGIILGGLVGHAYGAQGFAYGALIGSGLGNFLLQWWGARQANLKWKLDFNFLDPKFLRYLYLTIPLILGLGAVFSLEYTYRTYGLLGGEKTVAQLGYAYRLMFMAVGVLGYSVGAASFPVLAKWAKERQFQTMSQYLTSSALKLLGFSIPIALTLQLGGLPLVKLLFQRGLFSPEDTAHVAHYLTYYAPALLSLSIQVLFLRGMYALEKMWSTSLLNTALFILSLPFYSLGTRYFGLEFIPLLGVMVTFLQWAVLQWYWFRSVQQPFPLSYFVSLLKLFVLFGMGVLLNYQFAPYIQNFTLEANSWALFILMALAGGFHFATQTFFQTIWGHRDNLTIITRLSQKLWPPAKGKN